MRKLLAVVVVLGVVSLTPWSSWFFSQDTSAQTGPPTADAPRVTELGGGGDVAMVYEGAFKVPTGNQASPGVCHVPDFSITSLTSVGTTATATTAVPHLFQNGIKVGISGATTAITSLTQSGGVATADTASPHGMSNNGIVTISGATGGTTAYNGAKLITVVDADTFTYTISAATPSPATGSPVTTNGYDATFTIAVTGANTFTFTLANATGSPASGTISTTEEGQYGITCGEPNFNFNSLGMGFSGTQGGNGTLFVVGHDFNMQAAEITVPNIINGALNTLQIAPLRRSFFDTTGNKLKNILLDPTHQQKLNIGGLLPFDGKLMSTGYVYYDGGVDGIKSHFWGDTEDLALLGADTSRVKGPYPVSNGGQIENITNFASGGLTGGYMGLIPQEWWTALGGKVLTGNCCISVVGRSSYGPAAFAFDPANMFAQNASIGVSSITRSGGTATVTTATPHGLTTGNNAIIQGATFTATITRSGSTATVTTSGNHGFSNSQTVYISGADQTAYNGTYNVANVTATTFTYTVTGTPTTPATGSITATNSYNGNYTVTSTGANTFTYTVAGSPGTPSGGSITMSPVVPAQRLVYYSDAHNTALGAYNPPAANNPYWNGATMVTGIAFPEGTRSVLFFGRHGSNNACYGPGVAAMSVTGITRSGTTATATTASVHRLTAGATVPVQGANQSEYNGTVTVTGAPTTTTFTYEVAGSPTSPATGTITVGGPGKPVPPDNGFPIGNQFYEANCFDPSDLGKGDHAFPYAYYVWAYDANTLAQVASGAIQPHQAQPYAVWGLPLPYNTFIAARRQWLTGAAYDPSTGRIFLAQAFVDNEKPVIHVFKVTAAPAITTQPAGDNKPEGGTANFTVVARGGPRPTYQWQIKKTGDPGFANVPASQNGATFTGATTSSLSISPLPANGSALDNAELRVIVTSTGFAPINSSAGILAIGDPVPPAITTHPGNATTTAGVQTSFTAAASGAPAPTFTWFESIDGGAFNLVSNGTVSGTTYAGATTATLLITPAAGHQGRSYRAVATNSGGNAQTNAATLTVNVPPSISVQPTNKTTQAGVGTTFTAAADGIPAVNYQWQVTTDGTNFSNVNNGTTAGTTYSGATTSSMTVTPAATLQGRSYRVVASNGIGSPANSNAATLTVQVPPSITGQPPDRTITTGGTTTFTVAADGVPAATFQWQESTDGGANFTNISNGGIFSGATTGTLTLTGATTAKHGAKYRAVATNGIAPDATSNAGTLTVNFPPSITTHPSDQVGQNATFTVAANGRPDPTFQWQVSTDGGMNFNNLSNGTSGGATYAGATSASLQITNADPSLTGARYRAIASNTIAPDATSNAATLTVSTPPGFSAQPSNQTAVSGNNAVFTATVTGVPTPTQQWFESTDGGGSFHILSNGSTYSGVTTTTLTILGSPFALNGARYRLFATNGIAPDATSTSATLTVNTIPSFSTQPSNVTVNAAANASFTVAVSASPAATIQWQVSTDGGSNFSNVTDVAPHSGSTTATLTIKGAGTSMSGRRYRAVATNSAGSGTSNQAVLTVNPGTPFTDDTLFGGVTVIKAVHITELRARIDAQRVRFGLGAFSYTDPSLSGVSIKAVHITEMQTAIQQAYSAAGQAVPSFTAVSTGTTVLAINIAELRTAVVTIE